jgi:Glycosyltransferase family 87
MNPTKPAGAGPHLPIAPGRRFLLAVAVACLLLAPFFQLRLVMHMDPGHWTDLYSPWVGTRAALHGNDPYAPAVTAQIQRTIYGHPLGPTETWDRQAFVYPATIVSFLAPFTLLPWPVIHALFLPLAIAAAALAAWIWLRLCWPTAPRGTVLVGFLLILACWPATWGYFQRQPSLFVIAAMALVVFWFQKRQDIPAAIFLAATTVKPQMVVLLIPWLLLLALVERRWRFIAAFFAALALLVGAASLLVPHWIPHWIHASLAYARYPAKIPLLVFLFGRTAGFILMLALLAALVLRLRSLRFIARDPRALLQSVALILAATVCFMPANPWLVFNDLLLVPGVLLLVSASGPRPLAAALRAIAGLALVLALFVTPLCALLGAFAGFSLSIVMPPFVLNYLLPVPVTAALLALSVSTGTQDAFVAPIPAQQAAA